MVTKSMDESILTEQKKLAEYDENSGDGGGEYIPSGQWDNKVSGHYVTVRGILESNDDPSKTMLEISSWGDRYFIYFEDYVSYISDQPGGDIFSNILYITKEND